MREIKYRVWDKDLKSWRGKDSDGRMTALTTVRVDKGIYTLGFSTREEFVVQFCTDLKDKNDKEIYEGDIVKTDKSHIMYALKARRWSLDGIPDYTAGEVVFMNQGFNICQKNIGRMLMEEFSACGCCPCALEIIGNIFENPELIK